MKKLLLAILINIAMHFNIAAQTKIGAELYNYIKARPSFQPIAYLQTIDNWYAELRYNYENEKTFTFYGGKTFSWENNIAYNITAMTGFSTGHFTGVSFAANADAEWKHFYFSSQTQYSVSIKKNDSTVIKNNPGNFFFSWSELGYNISDNFFTGLAIQYTLQTGPNEFRPGIMAGLRFNKIQLPFYIFGPFQPGRVFFFCFFFFFFN
jgi:hypothetical protein